MTIIITQKYELYPDELLIPTRKRGFGGQPISFMRTIKRPENMDDAQWHAYALRIIERES